MESPEVAKAGRAAVAVESARTSSDSPPVQESPFSNFVKNLSPINPVKTAHLAQGFPGLNSSPLVFTSPRINLRRDANFLKRIQPLQALTDELPECENQRTDKTGDAPDESKEAVTQSRSEAIVHDADNLQDQPCSSSACVDEYLADPVDVDCANSGHSAGHSWKEMGNGVLSNVTYLEDKLPKFDQEDNMDDDPGTEVTVSADFSKKISEELQEKLMFDQAANAEDKHSNGEKHPNECLSIETTLSEQNLSNKRQPVDSVAQHAGVSCKDGSCGPLQLHPGSYSLSQAYEDSGKDTQATLLEHADTQRPEIVQQQRGLLRRCLQFDEAHPNSSTRSPSLPASSTNASSAVATRAGHEDLDLSSTKSDMCSIKRQVCKRYKPGNTILSSHHCGKSPVTTSKPSGIGLHLNSIVGSGMTGGKTITNIKLDEDQRDIERNELASTTPCCTLGNLDKCEVPSNTITAVPSGSTDGRCAGTISETSTSAVSDYLHDMDGQNLSRAIEPYATPHDKRKLDSAHANDSEEFIQTSPKKRRKKIMSSSGGDGCKRCNCKKSKCLKLYCDCFAAGLYCAEPCACQGCLNRPEYEKTVLETRQQIESRNPLAFAPKIIESTRDFSTNNTEEEEIWSTPSSARHKRGCNCKRSMCLKKYCECFQANVGCSDNCRCEGCKNVYGTKEDYGMTKAIPGNRVVEGSLEGINDEKLEMVAYNQDYMDDFHDPGHLMPLTPPFQFSDHGKGILRYRLATRSLASPNSDLKAQSSSAKTGRPSKSVDSSAVLERKGGTPESGFSTQITDKNSAEMETVDEFSLRHDSLLNLCRLASLPSPTVKADSFSESSKAKESCHSSLIPSYPTSNQILNSSLSWCISPITPVTQSVEANSCEDLTTNAGIFATNGDDTPEVLKGASDSAKTVKVSSPSRKRVSPPRCHLHGLSTSSSAALKSGRKFILKAVPPFPPLTPCVRPGASVSENHCDNQDDSTRR